MKINKVEARKKRHSRARRKINGTEQSPRLSIYKSLKATYVQLIDDVAGKTVVAAATSAKDFKAKNKDSKNDVATAKLLGKYVGEALKEKKIDSLVFDKSGYKYHGKVKAIADGAREAGIKF